MTRKEEILNKAIEFVDKSYVNVGIKTTHEASVAACQDIAEWADKTMLDKVCEWVEDNIWNYIETKGLSDFEILKEVKVSEMVKDIRKAMGE